MKAKEVLKLLNISRVTLYTYVKKGIIKTRLLSNGYYDYDEESVRNFSGNYERINVLYARVSTFKQKNDLTNQINYILKYCDQNSITIHKQFHEIASGIGLEREQLNSLLELVFGKLVKCIYITNKNRITRLSFSLFENIVSKFGTKIIVISDIINPHKQENEIIEDIISLTHILSTKMYSDRRKIKFELIKKDLELETDV